MNLLTSQDLLPAAAYEQQREPFRSQIIALKQRRRISVGPLITLVFENRETLRFQTQEMIRVEQILDPHKVQEELDVYNALMPGAGELSATLMIEITEPDRMKEWLDMFMGLDHGEKVAIRAGTEHVFGEFEGGHSHETKISAVHFVRFRPTASMIASFADLHEPVTMTVHHREYHAEVAAPGSLREEWLKDLR
ncbi:MAG: DUF3501 family protein [Nitrospirota bacterium]|nr:DUF3501 family protein [Nitrospirota bacterium]